jgi:hypothetical protein
VVILTCRCCRVQKLRCWKIKARWLRELQLTTYLGLWKCCGNNLSFKPPVTPSVAGGPGSRLSSTGSQLPGSIATLLENSRDFAASMHERMEHPLRTSRLPRETVVLTDIDGCAALWSENNRMTVTVLTKYKVAALF